MNNKGYLTAELVVSAAMALVLATFLITMTLNFKSKNDDEYQNTVFSVEKSVITKRIMDDIQEFDLNKIVVDNREITFIYGICPTGYSCFHTIRKLKITDAESNQLKIEYGLTCTEQKDINEIVEACQQINTSDKDYYTKTISNAYLDGNFSAITNNTSIDNEKILNIKIPIKNYFTNDDYSINLLIPYNRESVTVDTSPLNLVPNVQPSGGTISIEPVTYTSKNSTSNPYLTHTIPESGNYRLEVWGAQGGAYYGSGGKGGYAAGTVYLLKGTQLYVYVGGQGTYTSSTSYSDIGGYNGGGDAVNYGGSGGGASDIRLVSGAWNNSASLNSRIIVAGGGGGGQGYSGSSYTGGYGGGTSGGTASYSSSSYYAYGGSQSSGGSIYSTSYSSTSGTFGVGGKGGYYSGSTSNAGGGGGGGWYGGGGGYYYRTTGAGGSGFVITADTARNTPSSYTITAQYYLTNTSIISGNSTMPTVSGSSTMTGKTGNGAVKISYVTE